MSTAFDLELCEMGGGFLPPKPEIEFLYRIVVHCENKVPVTKFIYCTTGRAGAATGPEGQGLRGCPKHSTNQARQQSACHEIYEYIVLSGGVIDFYSWILCKILMIAWCSHG